MTRIKRIKRGKKDIKDIKDCFVSLFVCYVIYNKTPNTVPLERKQNGTVFGETVLGFLLYIYIHIFVFVRLLSA